ncbi:MAG: hypothetical protein HYU28_00240 [Actinobacteria bacterium]|nr:hypothetical protein [Actinomycetota bacterium]
MDRLYLHETVDIVGQGASPYMAHTAGFHADSAADRGLTLLGTWQVVGATGRWPQVVNIWEMLDGWDGWERLVRAANVQRARNDELNQWWDEAYQYRTGGFDRLMCAIEGSPDLAFLTAEDVRGEVFVHETAHVRVGAVRDYLRAVVEHREPVMRDHSHRLVGAYEVLLSETEAITVWATKLAAHVDLMRKREVDERLMGWRAEARSWLVNHREELMVPHPGTPLAPRS